MSPTKYQKSRRVEVQEDKKITLLMWSPQCSTCKRGYKKSLQFCVNYNVRKAFPFVQETLFFHFETFRKVSLRPVMNVHRKFEAEVHVVRRSNRLWAGLSTDLVIEQVLMRSLKTSGGLTRGSGMTERQRVI